MTTHDHTAPVRLLPAAIATVLLLVSPGCGGKESAANAADQGTARSADAPSTTMTDSHPGTQAGAKALLTAFLQPGADLKALSQNLRPTKEDYATVFSDEFAAKLMAMYDPAWQSGALVLKVNEGQTEVLLHGVPTEQITAWTKTASDDLPGGYEKIKDDFKPGLSVYAFKFVKPGETLGMAYDGLVHVNGHWCIFPKPYRAAR